MAQFFFPLVTFIPMPAEMTSATTRETRVLFVAMDALSTTPDPLTIYGFVDLLEILPDRGGRGTRALGANPASFHICGLITTAADIDGSLNATAQQFLGVISNVIVIVISGHPAHPPLFVEVDLVFRVRADHRASPASWSLNSYSNRERRSGETRISIDLGCGRNLGLGLAYLRSRSTRIVGDVHESQIRPSGSSTDSNQLWI
jgi:hypothetical protein